MTLVVAANLSDRIYISADSRLSRKREEGRYEVVTDDLLKVFPLSEKHQIAVGCVGNLHLIQSLITQLREDDTAHSNIRSFRNGVDARIRKMVEYFLTSTGASYNETVGSLVFAGSNPSKRRVLESQALIEQVGRCQELDRKYMETAYPNDVAGMTQMEIGLFAADLVQRKAGLKSVIFRGMMRTAEANGGNVRTFELDIPDHHLFIVDINATKQVPDEVVIVTDVGWGECIARGGGHNASMLPEDFFCALDLRASSGNLWTDTIPFVDYTIENYSPVISGSVVTTTILNGSIVVPVGELVRGKVTEEGGMETIVKTRFSNGRLEHFRNNAWGRFITASDFNASSRNNLSI